MPGLRILCPICTDEFRADDQIYSTSCGHLYHFACMRQWQSRSTSCPQCREHNPTTHKLFLNVEEVNNSHADEDLQAKLESSIDKINELQAQLQESELNIFHIQEQYTHVQDVRKQMERRIDQLNESESNFLHLQAQFSESEDRLRFLQVENERLAVENAYKTKELAIRGTIISAMNDSLAANQKEPSDAVQNELEHRLKHVTDKLANEISKCTQLAIDKIKLQDYIQRMEMQTNAHFVSDNFRTMHQRSHQEQLFKNVSSEPQIDSAGKQNLNSSSVLLCSVPLNKISGSLQDAVIVIAAKMNIFLTEDDIVKLYIMNRATRRNASKDANIYVQFRSDDFKVKFISNRGLLGKDEIFHKVNIKEFVDEKIHAIFKYANKKLRGTVFPYIVCNNNIIMAKKQRNDDSGIVIHSTQMVDELLGAHLQHKEGENVDHRPIKTQPPQPILKYTENCLAACSKPLSLSLGNKGSSSMLTDHFKKCASNSEFENDTLCEQQLDNTKNTMNNNTNLSNKASTTSQPCINTTAAVDAVFEPKPDKIEDSKLENNSIITSRIAEQPKLATITCENSLTSTTKLSFPAANTFSFNFPKSSNAANVEDPKIRAIETLEEKMTLPTGFNSNTSSFPGFKCALKPNVPSAPSNANFKFGTAIGNPEISPPSADSTKMSFKFDSKFDSKNCQSSVPSNTSAGFNLGSRVNNIDKIITNQTILKESGNSKTSDSSVGSSTKSDFKLATQVNNPTNSLVATSAAIGFNIDKKIMNQTILKESGNSKTSDSSVGSSTKSDFKLATAFETSCTSSATNSGVTSTDSPINSITTTRSLIRAPILSVKCSLPAPGWPVTTSASDKPTGIAAPTFKCGSIAAPSGGFSFCAAAKIAPLAMGEENKAIVSNVSSKTKSCFSSPPAFTNIFWPNPSGNAASAFGSLPLGRGGTASSTKVIPTFGSTALKGSAKYSGPVGSRKTATNKIDKNQKEPAFNFGTHIPIAQSTSKEFNFRSSSFTAPAPLPGAQSTTTAGKKDTSSNETNHIWPFCR